MTIKRVAAALIGAGILLSSCSGGGGGNPPPPSPTYTIGGTVSGLTGTGLVLQNNGGNNLAMSANGVFTFSNAIAGGGIYAVSVLTQPTSPSQNCAVTNGSGTVGSANVTNVAVNCVNTYTIGGTVSGLAGGGLVLQNNGANQLAISADGAFTFSIALISGATYNVTVHTQPPARNCTVANGTGSVASSNVTNVAVTCVLAPPTAPAVNLGFGVKELQFSWLAVTGADFYRLSENPDGISGYTQVGADLTTLSYSHTIPVHRRLNASYIVEACNSAGCTASAPQMLGTSLTQAIGYFKASNTGADDEFGHSVALSGDGNTLAVGAFLEDSSTIGIGSTPNELTSGAGAVYVYARSAGVWSQQAYVKASNTGDLDQFGFSVALSSDGNTLTVGAPGEDSSTTGINSAPNALAPFAGAVYVYTRSAGAWSQQAYVKASNTQASDVFGVSVAVSGDGNTLAVGAPGEDGLASGAGAVYVYTRSAGAWSQQTYLKASNSNSNHFFGISAALNGNGDTLAVGAHGEDSSSTGINSTPNSSAPAAGAAYVFTRNGSTWSQQAYVKASNTGAGDEFGVSIAMSSDGNTLAVGARGEDSSTTGIGSTPNEVAANAGAAYVFIRSGSTWSQQAYVKASNTDAGDQFGDQNAVALSGDGNTLAVGALLEDSSTSGVGSTPNELAPQAGAVYVFTRSAGTWSQQAYVKASNTGDFDQFGFSVALNSDGNTLAVGASREDSSTTGIGSTPNELAPGAGAAYLY